MESTHAITDPPAKNTIPSKLRDYYRLTKPEVNLLILMTTSAGYYLGSSGPLRTGRLFITLAGTLLVASGTATLNQCMERRYDAQMRRTANRPLVSGRLDGRQARWFGLTLSAAGGALLAVSVNVVSALLAIGTLPGQLPSRPPSRLAFSAGDRRRVSAIAAARSRFGVRSRRRSNWASAT